MNKDRLKEFEAVFNPQSIAVVGASSERKIGGLAVSHFLRAGYKGKIFPVNPKEREIMGLKAYPSLREIPEPVDYVIIMVPAAAVLEVIDDCVAKKVKVVQMFTAGFSETGEEEPTRLEREIVARARRAGIRLIGPNCVGISVPAKHIPVETTAVIGQPGDIAFLAQSGGHTETLADVGLSRGIRFSKLISFGNACDLNEIDFLQYLKQDAETRIIGLYLEGTTNGRQLYQLIAQISPTKPVVLLKGGRTEAGREMAMSHTGSLAGSNLIWTAAMKQAGAIEVNTLEEMADTLMALQYLPAITGNRIGIVSQLGGGAGGAGVLAADVCTSLGLELSAFTGEIKQELKSIVNAPGSILRNPLDLSLVGRDPVLLGKVLGLLASLPDIDLIMLNERPTFLLALISEAELHAINDVLVGFRDTNKKPLVVISPPGGIYEKQRGEVEGRLSQAGIPVYPSFERAAKAIVNVIRYWGFRVEMSRVPI
ncbi:MAG: CoA-binding protein [Dehalococcoidia bacterium]|nr:CoA-binding protein [Dehalococcoidia bacterium]